LAKSRSAGEPVVDLAWCERGRRGGDELQREGHAVDVPADGGHGERRPRVQLEHGIGGGRPFHEQGDGGTTGYSLEVEHLGPRQRHGLYRQHGFTPDPQRRPAGGHDPDIRTAVQEAVDECPQWPRRALAVIEDQQHLPWDQVLHQQLDGRAAQLQ